MAPARRLSGGPRPPRSVFRRLPLLCRDLLQRRGRRRAALVLLVCWPLSAAAETGALDLIGASGTIRVAYAPNAYPIAFQDAQGVPRGYSIDLCRHVIERVRSSLSLDALEIAWIAGNTPRRVAAVATGEADLECGTTTMTLARQRRVDFSNVVFIESGAVLVLRAGELRRLADLDDHRLGVVPETTTERRLRAAMAARSIEPELVPIRDAKDGRERLVEGELDAVAGDRLVLIGQVANSDEPGQFAIIDTDFSVEPYAFALPRNDADFRLAVNRGLADVYRSGEVDRIFERWFGDGAEPSRLLETVYFIYGFAD